MFDPARLRIDATDDTELKESLKNFGWSSEFPALIDEHGTVLVGHRRLRLAAELGIEPVIKRLTLGKGDAADAERLKLALVSNIGSAPMTMKDRQHFAQHLYQADWTMQRIAEALNVTHKTISKDLDGFVPEVQTSRPKGGRPKGRGKRERRKSDLSKRDIAASMFLDDGFTRSEIVSRTGMGEHEIQNAIEHERGRRLGEAEPRIDPATLSMTARKKVEIFLRQHKRQLDLENDRRVREEVKHRLEDVVLPLYNKSYEEYTAVIKARKGVMDRQTFRKIWSCLHPDRVRDPELKKRYEEAFHLFSKLELVLLNEKESPTSYPPLPRTVEELDAAKRKVQEGRRPEKSGGKCRAGALTRACCC